MDSSFRHSLVRCIAFAFALALLCAGAARAQDAPSYAQPYSQPELEQMLAPIALYPDALLSQILMAATYPLEVVEAARWSQAHRGSSGGQAVNSVAGTNWDPSVKSLVAFPQVLAMMDAKLDWTQRLGDAFLAQEGQVMDTVQGLRQRAYAAGTLRSNDQYQVNLQDGYYDIGSVDPNLAYVPYYDPNLAYGQWQYSAYPPVYWAPWPGYRARPGIAAAFLWGAAISLGADFYFGRTDWSHHRVNVVNVTNNYYRPPVRSPARTATNWQHDPDHRRGTPYRAAAVQQKFAPAAAAAAAAPEARREFRGHANATPAVPVVPVVRQPARVQPAPVAAAPRIEQRPHALEAVGRGPEARDASARGRASQQAAAQRPARPAAAPATTPRPQPPPREAGRQRDPGKKQ